jgi:hypothetical protein
MPLETRAVPAVVIKNISRWPHDEIDFFLDRKNLGKIPRGHSVELIVEHGRRSFQARVNSVFSVQIELALTSWETVALGCRASGIFQKRVDLFLLSDHLPNDRFGLPEKIDPAAGAGGNPRRHPGEWVPPW